MKISPLILFFLAVWASPVKAEVDPLKKVAAELADGISRHKGVRVAVIALPHHDQQPSDGPIAVSEKISSYLLNEKRFAVLERNQITQILSELHLTETGVLDPKTAQRIGKALDANVIVTGTLINLKDQKTEVNARALWADTGRIIAASRTVVPRNWSQKPRLGW